MGRVTVENVAVGWGGWPVAVAITGAEAEPKEWATLEKGLGPKTQTPLKFNDPGCVLIADTLAQQKAYVTQYLDGMELTARRLGKQDLRTLADQARQENAPVNQSTDPAVVPSRYARVAQIPLTNGDAEHAELPDP